MFYFAPQRPVKINTRQTWKRKQSYPVRDQTKGQRSKRQAGRVGRRKGRRSSLTGTTSEPTEQTGTTLCTNSEQTDEGAGVQVGGGGGGGVR